MQNFALKDLPALNGRPWIAGTLDVDHQYSKEKEEGGERKADSVDGQVANEILTFEERIDDVFKSRA